MNDEHMLSQEEIKRLRTTIQTLEFTGNQLAIIANALAFNLVHNDCLMAKNSYSGVYYEELHKLHDYVGSYVQGIIGGNDGGKEKKNNSNRRPKK